MSRASSEQSNTLRGYEYSMGVVPGVGGGGVFSVIVPGVGGGGVFSVIVPGVGEGACLVLLYLGWGRGRV